MSRYKLFTHHRSALMQIVFSCFAVDVHLSCSALRLDMSSCHMTAICARLLLGVSRHARIQLSQWSACNLIRVIGHQIIHVSVHIYPLLQVKGYWPFMLLARQMHLYHLCQNLCHTQDEITCSLIGKLCYRFNAFSLGMRAEKKP